MWRDAHYFHVTTQLITTYENLLENELQVLSEIASYFQDILSKWFWNNDAQTQLNLNYEYSLVVGEHTASQPIHRSLYPWLFLLG